MAKRFTDTELWKQDWFLELPKDYKLFYFYLKDNCDHAGIFKVNLRSFCLLNEVKIDSKKVLELFNADKVRINDLGNDKWLLIDFYYFQYGSTLNKNNRVHMSAFKLFESNNIDLGSIRGLNDLKEGVKDKDKDKDKRHKKGKNLIERKKEFKADIKTYSEKYEDKMLDDFFNYWSEHGKGDKKMRFEEKDKFAIALRLATWKKNDDKYNGIKKIEGRGLTI